MAIACRDEADWQALGGAIDEDWCRGDGFAELNGRIAAQDELDAALGAWTARRGKRDIETMLRDAGVPVAAVAKPAERIDEDPSTARFGLWPTVPHANMGDVRVDGQPVHFSKTDWRLTRGGPCLGEHNDEVLTGLLGFAADEVAELREEGVI